MDGLRAITVIEKPWGTEEIWASTHRYTGKFLYIKGGHRLSRKYHRMKNHTIRIMEGVLTIEAGPLFEGDVIKIFRLEPGMVYHVKAETIHRFCAEEGDVKIVEVSSAGPSDSVRLEDDYLRITNIPEPAPSSGK